MARDFMIIDGSSLMYRAFYALPLLTTAGGQYTNAVYGFSMMLVKLFEERRPDLMAVAFDKGKTTFRNELYGDYKGRRKATPGELSVQFPLVQELLGTFGVRVLEEAGFEADDIIGTLAEKAAAAGCAVTVVTGDRDALQLLQPGVKVLLTKKGISDMAEFDEAAFREKYGIAPRQLTDLKGLMGDASDNIPGVPGVGEKTATKLIVQFQSVENVLAQIDQVAGKKLQENLRTHRELALLSKNLATIVRDMAIDFDAAAFEPRPDAARIQAFLLRCECRSVAPKITRLFPDAQDAAAPEPAPAAPAVELGRAAARELAGRIKAAGRMAFYSEWEGRTPFIKLTKLTVAFDGGEAFCATRDGDGWSELTALLADEAVAKITHDCKPLYHACRMLGRPLASDVFDAMLAAYLLDPTAGQYGLTALSERYLLESGPSSSDPRAAAGWSARCVARLAPVLERELEAHALGHLYRQIELPLLKVLAAMEAAGIYIDTARLREMTAELAARVEALLKEIYRLAGAEFNVNSTKQLGEILFDTLKLPVIKKTKRGYSTDAAVLEKLSGYHPIVDLLLEYRLLTKMKSTYLDGLLPLVQPETGRIHTTFNQTVTATGRLSSSDPNLQNIPVRSEIGRRIRSLFVPGPSYQLLMSADYSQIELRVLAHMSGDQNFAAAFAENQDVHTRTAAEVFDVPIDQVTPELRRRAKAVNFGIVYGISDYGLSRDLGVTRQEAALYIENYFAKCGGVKAFIDGAVEAARRDGYVTTLSGRRRYLPDINSGNYNVRSFAERTAMNTPIQGSAADIIKIAMIGVYDALAKEGLRSRILLQVHDELVLEIAPGEAERAAALVKTSMENAMRLAVPLSVDVNTGVDWATTK